MVERGVIVEEEYTVRNPMDGKGLDHQKIEIIKKQNSYGTNKK